MSAFDDSAADGPAGEPGRTASAVTVTTAPRKRHGFWFALREFVLVVGFALLLSAMIRTFLVQAFWVPSGSMEQTLAINDRILAWKPASPQHGDVVVFRDPGSWLPDPVPVGGVPGALRRAAVFVGLMPSDSGDDLVKRVIGVGGDTVSCCSVQGHIERNGVALDEPYIFPDQPTNQVTFSVTVPAGKLFVLGDHRGDSADSRFHLDEDNGMVPVENVVGRAVVVMWPPSRWATLPNYASK
ncbi:MAG: signal peptidase I [Candidatus Nanopelagicales bacterium]